MLKPLNIIAGLLGVFLLIAAIIYWMSPASSLPSFLPGYDPSLSAHHLKHGIGAFILALGAFAFVWFQTGKKSAPQSQ